MYLLIRHENVCPFLNTVFVLVIDSDIVFMYWWKKSVNIICSPEEK